MPGQENPQGYKPHYFLAEQDGIYKITFRANAGNPDLNSDALPNDSVAADTDWPADFNEKTTSMIAVWIFL